MEENCVLFHCRYDRRGEPPQRRPDRHPLVSERRESGRQALLRVRAAVFRVPKGPVELGDGLQGRGGGGGVAAGEGGRNYLVVDVDSVSGTVTFAL